MTIYALYGVVRKCVAGDISFDREIWILRLPGWVNSMPVRINCLQDLNAGLVPYERQGRLYEAL